MEKSWLLRKLLTEAMRVENTPTKLVLYSRPWGLWLFSAIFPLGGLPFLITTFQIHSLTCKRTEQPQGFCEISHLTAFGYSSQTFPLINLKEARVQEQSNSEGKASKIILLTTDAQELSLKSYSDDFDDQGKQDIVSRINTFLQNPKELNLSVQQYPKLSIVFFILIWYGFALFIFFYGCQIRTCTFDKTIGVLRITRKSLLGTKITDISLESIINVIVHEESSDGIPVEPVSLELTSGKSIGVYRDANFKNWKKDAEYIAGLIREFLKLSSTN